MIGVLDIDKHVATNKLCLGFIPNNVPISKPMILHRNDIVKDAVKDVRHTCK